MFAAVCRDFADAGVKVTRMIDSRIEGLTLDAVGPTVQIRHPADLINSMRASASKVDWVLVIAPESNNRLLQCLQWLQAHATKLLNPSLELTYLATSKNRFVQYLASHGIHTPRVLGNPETESDFPQTYVVKPDDGCGGEAIRILTKKEDWAQFDKLGYHIEEMVEGISVSVSVLGTNPLTPLRQVFLDHPFGRFDRCVDDLDTEIKRRAMQLARRVIEVLPETRSFFGMDLVIGDQDFVIEVNPRITMSYPVLSTCVDFNLAQQMIEIESA